MNCTVNQRLKARQLRGYTVHPLARIEPHPGDQVPHGAVKFRKLGKYDFSEMELPDKNLQKNSELLVFLNFFFKLHNQDKIHVTSFFNIPY